jgi:hypothetical protein
MTFEDAKRYLDAGRWITRPSLEDWFLSRPWAMPVRLRESFGDDSDLHLIFNDDGRPLVHDMEQEFSMTTPYLFTSEDQGATDWAVVPTVTD